MTEWIWINGKLTTLADARIDVEDRGFQFADGVYEVFRVYDGRVFTLREHLDRLAKSCEGIDLTPPFAADGFISAISSVLGKSGVRDGMIYLQVTRGASPRNHIFPENAKPTVLCYARPLPPVPAPGTGEGAKLQTVQDERWKRCWVKSIALLPNVLAKNQAIRAGADEAVFVENGLVSECSASNFFAVIDGSLVTHPVGPKVLPGITRKVLLEVAGEIGIPVQERSITLDQAKSAQELFITSTTREISWVGQWDGRTVGGGRCGKITESLHRALQARIRRELLAAAA